MTRFLLLACALGAWTAARAADAAPGYIGAQACAACHPAQFRLQSSTAHARALATPAAHVLSSAFVGSAPVARQPAYRLQIRRDGARIAVHGEDRENTIDLPLDWAFGAGRQAVTFVSRVDPAWYVEHYLTYYSAGRTFGPTPGQESLAPSSLPEAMGLMYKALDPDTGMMGCFQCHSTGPVSSSGGELRPTEPGVRCEACHGPGVEHQRVAARGDRRAAVKAIANPKRLDAAALNRFCGNCHRPPAASATAIDWNNAWNVRHQPVYFSQSACFRKSGGAFSCLTCHDPHRPDAPEGSYNAVCAGCHMAQKLPPATVCLQTRPSNCVECHMPRVMPQSYLRFTNHWIGVFPEGARLKPRR